MALGRLSVVLDANIANFQSDLGRAARIAEQQSRAMQRSFEGATKNIAAALAGAFAFEKLTSFVKSTIDANDALGKLSQKVGVSSETLSALGIEARKAGVDVGATQSAFVKLAQAATDSGSQGAKALAAMGINIKQFLALKPAEQFDLVARKFASYQDGARKAALATALFGKSGADLIPLLNDVGNKGLDSITQKAIKVGTAVGGDAVRAAQLFNDSLSDLQDRLRGAVNQGLAQFTPAIEHVSALMNSPDFQKNIEAVAQGIAAIAKSTIDAANNLVSFTRGYSEFAAKMQNGAGAFDLPGMLNERDNIQDELKQRQAHPVLSGINSFLAGSENNAVQNALEGGRPRIQSMSTADLQKRLAQLDQSILHAAVVQAAAPQRNPQEGDMRGLFVGLGGNQAPIVGAGLAAAKNKPLEDFTKALRDQVLQLQLSAKQFELYQLGARGASNADLDYASSLIDVRDKLKQQADAQKALTDFVAQHQAEIQGVTDAELQFTNTMAMATKALNAHMLTWEQFSRIAAGAVTDLNGQVKDKMSQMSEFAKQAAHNMQDSFADFLFDPFKDGVKGMLGDFADMLRRMAAQALAAKVFDSIGAWGKTNQGDGGWEGVLAGFASAFGSGKAAGGPVQPYSMQRVNEKGPELLTVAGKDFLMMGGQGGTVTPNNRLGGSTQVINVNVQPTSSHRTAAQVARAVAREQQLAVARS